MRRRKGTRGTSLRGWREINPRSTVADQLRGRVVFDTLARQYADRGAIAVVLAGSWARGEAHRASDIDMWVLGRRAGRSTLERDGFVVHVERTTERLERTRFREPRRVGGSVPGWRDALLVYDPKGVAAKLRAEARRFRWLRIAARCDRWVAEEITAYAEEVTKVVRALGNGSLETAAVQRNLLVDRLAVVMAVHRRILWGTENELWERVGRRIGGPWWAAQRKGLGVPRGDVTASCEAALELYRLTSRAVRRTLRPEQARVVAAACSLIEARVAHAPSR
jgi:predicted nucleotidyltransferase